MYITPYQQFIHKSRYARYLPEHQRRESWEETIGRFIDFFDTKLDRNHFERFKSLIVGMDVMPSMRALMTAGKALEKDNVAGYNCAYTAVDSLRAFDECLYILMCGTGLGFSVERQYIAKLPIIAEDFHETDTVIVVRDSKIGWAKAYKELIAFLYQGLIPKWDLSKIRPAGAPLVTFGGRASGPEPLDELFKKTIHVISSAKGRQLTSLECHDIMNYIGEAVVVGGVRRTAEISLSNHSDERMRNAKMGNWFMENPQRALANNSICYTERPDVGAFMREWSAIYESRSGERGIFNRRACQAMAPERRDKDWDFGTNPCSEIVLRSKQFCNLSEVVARYNDTMETLKTKIEAATMLGTVQASLTDFRYLGAQWKKNCEEEALLGVSITGIFDCPALLKASPKQLEELRDHAVKTNEIFAKEIGINPSASVTCVKPSGTVSQLVDSSSGIHPRHARHYIRRVRNDKKDPLSQKLIDNGIEYLEDPYNKDAWVFEFPMKATGSKTRHDVSAMEQLELWKKFALHYCEHKPSMTCYVKESEWPTVGAWIWENFDIVNGISFLPSADEGHVYQAAPYEDMCSADFAKWNKKYSKIELTWDNLIEHVDDTTGSQEYACVAGACEI
jgi:ribonucleoside-triphosphate reductase